jgi:hypothetical protein
VDRKKIIGRFSGKRGRGKAPRLSRILEQTKKAQRPVAMYYKVVLLASSRELKSELGQKGKQSRTGCQR